MPNLSPIVVICAIMYVTASFAQESVNGETGVSTEDALSGLQSKNPQEILFSVRQLATTGDKRAVEPIIELLSRGPRNDITNAALECLGAMDDPAATDTLIRYLNHRRPDARITAVYAMENVKSDRVARALEKALADSDKQVRATAALALGKIGDLQSVSILFRAFDRSVYDAAISIGILGTPEHALQLTEYLGRADIKVLLPGFDEFLRRDKFPESAKLQILEKLFELAGPEVRRFALAFKASFPPETKPENNELYKKVSQMVRQIQGD